MPRPESPAQSPPPNADKIASACAELQREWHNGESASVEAILERHLGLHRNTEAILDLIYTEIVLREELGETPSPEDYAARFPELAEPLSDLFAVHDAVVSDSSIDSDSQSVAKESTPHVRRDSSYDGLPRPSLHAATQQPTALDGYPTEPQTIGGYEILEEVGRGGMGIVYKARQPVTGRIVALKVVLTGRFASEDEIVRFQTEAQAAAKLEHPGIVPVYDAGRAGDLYYLSMAFVEGETLADVLARGPLAPKRAAEVALELAGALAEAHRHHVIHRDLKPQNVLVDGDGRVRITDFGLARQDDQLFSVTSTGQVVGTPQYMPPEQAAGKQELVGPASDVYSLGATLYCSLTGRAPFAGAAAVDVLTQVIRDEPVSPGVLNPAVPPDLDTICLKCLEKEPHNRYATARQLADDLQRYLNGEAIVARPIGWPGRLWRWSRRKPLIAGMSASIVLLTVALVVGSLTAVVRLRQENDRTNANLTRAVAAEGLANDRLLDSLIARVKLGRQSGAQGQKVDSLAAVAEAAELLNERSSDSELVLTLRNEAVACLELTDVESATTFKIPDANLSCMNPTGSRCAAWDESQSATVLVDYDLQGEICRWPIDVAEVEALQFSANGSRLAVHGVESGRSRLVVCDATEPESPPFELPLPASHFSAFDFIGGGESMVVITQDGLLCVVDTQTGALRRSFETDVTASGCRVSADGTRLVVWSGARFRFVDLDDGSVTEAFEHGHSGEILACAWNKDGRLLVTAGADHLAVVWNVSGEPQRRCVLEGHQSWITSAAFHPYADILMTAGPLEGRTVFWNPWRGVKLVTIDGAGRAFSNDGKQLFGTIGDHVARWPLATNTITRRLYTAAHLWPAVCGQLSSDGRFLMTFGWYGFQIWDFPSGVQLADYPLTGILSACLTPDDEFVVASSDYGLQRWPLIPGLDGGLELGSPEKFPHAPDITDVVQVWFGPHGALAVGEYGSAFVSQRGTWPEHGPIVEHDHANLITLSPDGRWLATYGEYATGVHVWDAKTGELVRAIKSDSKNGHASFSPCGRWLFAGADGDYSFWPPGHWNSGRRIPSLSQSAYSVAFSRDGSTLAASNRRSQVQLIDVESGTPLVTIPGDHHATSPCFSADGHQLVLLDELTGVRIWDLVELRTALRQRGLEW